jgi:hypothetical protein
MPGAADPVADASLLAEQATERLSGMLGDRFGGAELVETPEADTLRVSVVEPTFEDVASIANSADLPVEIVEVNLSEADLDAIAAAVADALRQVVLDARPWRAGRTAAGEVNVGITDLDDAEYDAIVYAAESEAAARGLDPAIVEDVLVIEIDPESAVPPTSLRDSYPPYRAGSILRPAPGSSGFCSAAFTISVPDWGQFGTSAGHCLHVGEHFTIGSGSFVTSGSQYRPGFATNVDASAFPLGSNGRAELIRPNGTGVRSVHGSMKYFPLGSRVCKYGWGTQNATGQAERCGPINFRGALKLTSGAVITEMVCAEIDTRGGDSGGPVYQYRGDGGVDAAGITSAGHYAGQQYSGGGGYYRSGRLCFSEMDAIVDYFDASVLTVPPPDRDSDGVADLDDPCPNFAGPSGGCRPAPPPTLQGDMIGDDRPDLFAFYKYDGNVTALWAWDGGDLSAAPRKLWQSGAWNTDKIIPAGVGDVDGDGKVELFAFFAYSGNTTAMFMWKDTAEGVRAEKVWEDPSWDGTRVIPAGVADVDADGKPEIFAFYRYDTKTALFRWRGSALATATNENRTSTSRIWEDTSWDGSRIVSAGLGDSDADGRADLFAFYRYEGSSTGLWRWPGSSLAVASNSNYSSKSRVWLSDGWAAESTMPAGVGDVTGDGRADLVTFYRYSRDRMGIWIFPGDALGSPTRTWISRDGEWPARRNVPVGLADLASDGRLDIPVFTRNASRLRINVFRGIGSGTFAIPTVPAWDTPASNFVPERTAPL